MVGSALAILAVIAAAFLNIWPFLPSSYKGPLFVSPNGSDLNSGHSADKALGSIQKAADMVAPGQTVLILPGVYREDLRVRRGGEPDAPVLFKAAEPGTVIISGAADQALVQALEWKSEGDRIWSAKVPWPIYHVVGNGENFYHVRWADGRGDSVYHWVGKTGRVEVLRGLMRRPKPFGAFTFEDDRLFVAFADGRKPSEHQLHIHRQVPRPYASWSLRSANVWAEASHIRFEGLQFYMGVGAGVLLWNASDVSVIDCAFSGAVAGIVNFPSIGAANQLVIQHSHYHNYPQFFWGRGWLKWEEVYRNHSMSSLVSARGDGIVVRDNFVTHAGDGIELSTDDLEIKQGVLISRNLLVFGTDDAFELDGFAKRVSIKDNVVVDFFVSLGLSPVLAGPVWVRDNLFLGYQPEVMGAHFKLLNPWGKKPGKLAGAIRNILVTGNIFTGNRLSWWNEKADNLRDISIIENRFDRTTDGNPWSPAVIDRRNVYGVANPLAPAKAAEFATHCVAKGGAGSEGGLIQRSGLSYAAGVEFSALDQLHRRLPASRPGPRWLNHESSPATRGVPARFAHAMEAWQCD